MTLILYALGVFMFLFAVVDQFSGMYQEATMMYAQAAAVFCMAIYLKEKQ